MKNRLWSAHLVASSPRYQWWREVLGSDDVPLKHPGERTGNLGDPVAETATVYELDLAALSAGQHERLVRAVATRFNASVSEVRETLAREGFPIRSADVRVAFSMRAFL